MPLNTPFVFGQSGFGQASFGSAPNNAGTQSDILARLQRLIPPGWFPANNAPLESAVLTGIANIFAFIYSLIAYVKLQTRLATATDGFLDLAAYDFFGADLLRNGRSDAAFRTVLRSSLFIKRGTLLSIYSIVESLGDSCVVTEPYVAGSGNVNGFGGVGCYSANMFYSANGNYGSRSMPFQCFVNDVSAQDGEASSGYGEPIGGYGVGAVQYVSPVSTPSSATEAEIAAAITSVLPVCGVAWIDF